MAKLPVSEIQSKLVAAAQVILDKGHTKHTLKDCDGRVCIIGAFNTVQLGGPLHSINGLEQIDDPKFPVLQMADAVIDVLRKRGIDIGEFSRNKYFGLAAWNNRRDTTKEDVIGVCREAAKSLGVAEEAII